MTRVSAVLLLVWLLPADGKAQGLGYFVPSVSFGVLTDSNVLSIPSPGESDVVQRTTPSVRAGYRTALWQLVSGYTFDSDRFRKHPTLSSHLARQLADVDVRYAGRVTTFSAMSSFLTSNTPEEVNSNTGLVLGRTPVARFTAGTAVGYQFTTLNRATATLQIEGISLRRPNESFAAAQSATTRNVRVGLERRLSATDLLVVQYQDRAYSYSSGPDGSGSLPGTSRTALVGWTRNLSPLTQTSILAGPRISNGATRLELAFDLRRQLRSGTWSVGASRTEFASLGEVGAIEVSSVNGALNLRPVRRLELAVTPSLRYTTAQGSELRATIPGVSVTATGIVTRWLSVEGSYAGTRPRQDIPQLGRLMFPRDVLLVRAIVSRPGPTAAVAPVAPLR